MNVDTATAFITANKGQDITIVLTDGDEIEGQAFSVNSKGVNVKVGDKTRSVALSRIDALELMGMDDEDTDEDIYAALGDGMTTAELAAHLSDALNTDLTPKELRVHLRALGLGVGKGRKYSLTATEFRMVRDLIKADA